MRQEENVEVRLQFREVYPMFQYAFILFGLTSLFVDYSRATLLTVSGLLLFGIFYSWLNRIHVSFLTKTDLEGEDYDEE